MQEKEIHLPGTGTPPSKLKECQGPFEIVIYSKKNTLKEEIANSSLLIGHAGITQQFQHNLAGVGTIFDAVEAEKDMIVVPNTALMNNHQSEIATEMVCYCPYFLTISRQKGAMSYLPLHKQFYKLYRQSQGKGFVYFPRKREKFGNQ